MSITRQAIGISGLTLLEQLKAEKKKMISKKILMDKKDNHKYPIEDIPFSIPDDWVWCYLSDVSIIQEGPGIRKHQYSDGGVQFLTVTNILEGSVDLEKSKKYISLDKYQKTYRHFTINNGDIVTACSGGSWGKSAIYNLDEKLILNTSTLRLRFFNDLGSNEYLYYLTKASFFKSSLASHSTGQQPNYGYSHYSRIPIPLPALPEQQYIAVILDKAFAVIAKAKANAEQNLKNAKELFESYLQEVFENKGEGWKGKTLEQISETFGRGKSKHRPRNDKKLYGGNYPFIQTGDVRNCEHYITDYSQTYNEVGLAQSKLWPKGTICITIAANIAETGVLSFDACFPDSVIGIVVNKKVANVDYVEYLLQFFKVNLQALGKGAAQDNINLGTFENKLFPFPSIAKQQAIVRKLDTLAAEIKKLEAIYQQKIYDLEELKKSVLQKAFNGELKTSKAVAA